MCRKANKKPWILWSLSFRFVITVYYCVTNVQNVRDYTSLVFWMSSFSMHFSPWLYVFVVCSICKRKKKRYLSWWSVWSILQSLGWDFNGIFLYMLLFVCVADFYLIYLSITLKLNQCSVKYIYFSRCPTQTVRLTRLRVDQTFDSITPHLTKSKALTCRCEIWRCAHYLPSVASLCWITGCHYPFGRLCKFSFSIHSWLYKAFFSRLQYASYSCFPLVGNFAMLLLCFPWRVVYIVYVHVLRRTCVFLTVLMRTAFSLVKS